MQDVLSEITIFGVRDQLRRARSWGGQFSFELFVRVMRGSRVQMGVLLGFRGCPEAFLGRGWSDLGRRVGLSGGVSLSMDALGARRIGLAAPSQCR